ncbi:MAG TPA: hypothetical protein VK915_04740 [Gaiellaceae bacterium]|nr:hypothetical protein [Gaiellaceae bacterium]
MSWWMPLVLAAACIVGLAIAFSLTAGRPRSDPAAETASGHGGRRKSRYRQDNELAWNPGAFVAAALLIGVLVLVAVLVEVL